MDRLETRHFLVGPEMGEDIKVVLEKGKVLHIKALTPGIEVAVCICTWNNVFRTLWCGDTSTFKLPTYLNLLFCHAGVSPR